MAWNGSKVESAASALDKKRIADRKVGRTYTMVVAAGIVAIGCLCLYYFRHEDSSQVQDVLTDKPNLINEVMPASSSAKSKPEEVEQKPISPDARPTKVGEIVNNYIMLPSGKLHYIRGEVTNNVAATQPKEWFEVFEHHCENEIALYLTIEPGETLVGTPVYRGQFKKEFLKSLETPIVVDKDDSQEIKNLKRDVTAAKIELKAALDRGEDIEQIMLDTRSQLQDLAAYKRALESDMMDAIRNGATSSEDIDDFIAAADRLLAERGIAPMKLNPIARVKLERMIQSKSQPKEGE